MLISLQENLVIIYLQSFLWEDFQMNGSYIEGPGREIDQITCEKIILLREGFAEFQHWL